MSTKKPVTLVVGAGDYLGSAVAKRFSKGELKIAASRRRGNLTSLIGSYGAQAEKLLVFILMPEMKGKSLT